MPEPDRRARSLPLVWMFLLAASGACRPAERLPARRAAPATAPRATPDAAARVAWEDVARRVERPGPLDVTAVRAQLARLPPDVSRAVAAVLDEAAAMPPDAQGVARAAQLAVARERAFRDPDPLVGALGGGGAPPAVLALRDGVMLVVAGLVPQAARRAAAASDPVRESAALFRAIWTAPVPTVVSSVLRPDPRMRPWLLDELRAVLGDPLYDRAMAAAEPLPSR